MFVALTEHCCSERARCFLLPPQDVAQRGQDAICCPHRMSSFKEYKMLFVCLLQDIFLLPPHDAIVINKLLLICCPQDVIERVQDLEASGDLTGVIDDRGKFIYITMDELEAVAKYVRQHGRVSISELAESSNRLITLDPDMRRIQAATQSVLEEISAPS